MIEPANARASKVLASNCYFALATTDADGPWVAALAFTRLAPNYLCFFSQTTSRHGRALRDGAAVAGLIYNSQCSAEDAESIQFSGRGEVKHDRETIAAVLGAGSDTADPAEVEKHLQDETTLLYRISVDEAWVLDQAIFQEKGVDAREPFDVAAVFGSD